MTNMKRNMKRLTAVLLSLMMALLLLVPSAFAEGTEKITVNVPDGLGEESEANWSKFTVTAYQVFKQSNEADQDNEKLYTVAPAFEAFFNIDVVKGAFGQKEAAGSDALMDVYLYYDDDARTLMATNTADDVADKTNIHLSYSATDAENKVTALDKEYTEADLVSRIASTDVAGAITAQNGDIATFYTWIEKYIEDAKPASTAQKQAGEVKPESVEINELEKGYYALIFSGMPAGVSLKQGILVKTGTDVNLKAEELPLIKQVKNHGHTDENFNDSMPLKATTANVGDTLDYHITSKVPTVTDSENLTTFKLEDMLANQKVTGTLTLTLTKDGASTPTATFSAAITEDQKFIDIKDGDTTIAVLTVSPYDEEKNTQEFTVDFLKQMPDTVPDPMTEADLVDNDTWKDYQGYNITVDYSAVVTADAVRVNGNDVKLYINDWDNPLEDSTEVYTYGIEVRKTFSDTRKTYDGVEFTLYAANADGTQSGTAIGLFGDKGVYRMPVAGEAGTTTTTLVLDSTDGTLTITGLDAGTYWLEETQAPDGYNKADPIKIVLTPDADDKSVLDGEESYAKYNGTGEKNLMTVPEPEDDTSISLGKFEVYNQKGFSLPQTGGAGTWMFTVGGIALIAVAGGLFIASRKKDSSK